MRFVSSILGALIKPVDRRAFAASVRRHDADAYDKRFDSWDHLMALVFAQLSGASSLRGVEAQWNAGAHCHYHLGSGPVRRSTLADANRRRPPAVFEETFERLCGLLGARTTRQDRAMLRLIDSTPIPLDRMCAWAGSNGRIRGLKLHLVYAPETDHPRRIEITPARVNDIEIGRKTPLEAGASYVFDKAYCSFAFWQRIHEAKAVFVTRLKQNARLAVTASRPLPGPRDKAFTVLADETVRFTGQKARGLCMPLRRIVLERTADGRILTLVTNDHARDAVQIGRLYKARWQIELLFRWIKQHLKIKRFLGRSENAVRLQILAAMIAFLLLRLAQRIAAPEMPALRFAELAGAALFVRKSIDRIDRPPPVNPSKPRPISNPKQLTLSYA